MIKYCSDPYFPRRRQARTVHIGDVAVGGDQPIRIQSMTTPATADIAATVGQMERLADVGCEIVRITVPTITDAGHLPEIRTEMRRRGIRTPVVADIHFSPAAAMAAVEHVEKVRINPGNYVDSKRFDKREYTDEEYAAEVERIAERFIPLVDRAKELGVAIRVGTNHGSLSDRIMNRYGDSPEGMVESALEFLRIARDRGFHDLVLSMKSSNPLVMIQAYRVLAGRMELEGMDYPFHLGVTEAGEGEDGRIKSAIGIGALLEDGIGDTIRVSLTEDPVEEIPVAREIVAQYSSPSAARPPRVEHSVPEARNPFRYVRRSSVAVSVGAGKWGGDEAPRVEVSLGPLQADSGLDACINAAIRLAGPLVPEEGRPDLLEWDLVDEPGIQASGQLRERIRNRGIRAAVGLRLALAAPDASAVPSLAGLADRLTLTIPASGSVMKEPEAWVKAAAGARVPVLWEIAVQTCEDMALAGEIGAALVRCSLDAKQKVLLALSVHASVPSIGAYRLLVARLTSAELEVPLVLRHNTAAGEGQHCLDSAAALGSLLCDGIGDAVRIEGVEPVSSVRLCFTVLQGTRLRLSRTEFISCPSCGRTLFDLESTTQRIKKKTGHLKGVKIAIMGCIVNGPGEMADADFGYVGGAPEKVNLFVGMEMVARHVPAAIADERLIELIKEHGKWVDPPL